MHINSSDVGVPESSVSVYEAIFGRRNVKEFTAEPVSDETLERMFSAAIWAPNHRLTDPTRFFAVRKDSPLRKKIAETAWQTTYDGVANPNTDQKKRSADASRDRVLNAPAMVYVYSLSGDNEEVTQENYATSCCAVHNMALAAFAEGLSIDWSTGGLTRLPRLTQTLGADGDWTMVGVVFAGQAKAIPSTQRMSHSEVVSWLE